MIGRRIALLGAAALLAAIATPAAASAQGPAATPVPTPVAPAKRGAEPPPTHSPQPELPPRAAFAHVQQGHAEWLEAAAKKLPPPAPAERPSGAGRYVCAVLVCADCDRDVPALLGLRRSDVLLISVPGPFATPEIVATLERQVLQQRLSLVLVLTHTSCGAVPAEEAPGTADALTERARTARADAVRRRLPIGKALAQSQREQLLSASRVLADHVREDTLRIVPAELESRSGAITWHPKAADQLPLAPVK